MESRVCPNRLVFESLREIRALTKICYHTVTVASHGVGGGGASMAFEELIMVRDILVVLLLHQWHC